MAQRGTYIYVRFYWRFRVIEMTRYVSNTTTTKMKGVGYREEKRRIGKYLNIL